MPPIKFIMPHAFGVEHNLVSKKEKKINNKQKYFLLPDHKLAETIIIEFCHH